MSGIQNGCAMGFDISTTVLDYFTSTVGTGGSAAIGSGGRNSTNCIAFTVPNNSNSSSGNIQAFKTLPVALSHPRIAFPFTLNALPTSGQTFIILTLRDAGSAQCDLRLRPDGKFFVTRAGTQIGNASTYVYSVNTFPHFEFDVLIDNSGSFDLLVNGASAFGGSQTGLDTQNTANATVSEFGIGLAMTTSLVNQTSQTILKVDDLIVRDDALGGDCRVREQLPTGTGSTDDGVATGAADSRQAVDDTTPDGDSSYTALQNVGDKVLLTYPSIPAGETIVAVGGFANARKSGAGTATFKYEFKIGGSNYMPGSDQAPSAASYAYFPEIFMQSPDTSSDWGNSEVNAMEMGVQKTA